MLNASPSFGRVKNIGTLVEYYDTTMCLPSRGIGFRAYSHLLDGNAPNFNSYSNLSQIYPAQKPAYGTLPNLSLYWGTGTPLSIPFPGGRYAMEFFGSFYVENQHFHALKFQFAGECSVALEFDGDDVNIGGAASASLNSGDYAFKESEEIDTAGRSGTWIPLRIKIWGMPSGMGGVVCRYTFGDGEFRVLNAGVVSCEFAPGLPQSGTTSASVPLEGGTAGSIGATALPYVVSIEGESQRNEARSYSVVLPLVSKSGAERGYYENDEGRLFCRPESGDPFEVRLGRLIEIYAGYQVGKNPLILEYSDGKLYESYEVLPRFSGIITGFRKDRRSRTVTLLCQDFSYLAKAQINENYPNPASYWNFGYFSDAAPGEPDGRRAPIAYDKWPVTSALLDLLIKAGIPAGRFYGRQRKTNQAGGVVAGGGKVVDLGYQLDWSTEYSRENPQKDFLYRGSFGDPLWDMISGFTDAYGYRLYFDAGGDLVFRPANNPDIIYTDKMIGNMIGDSDGRFGRHKPLGAAVVTEAEYNSGTASWAISGTGDGARLNEVYLERDRSHYFSFYAKHAGNSNGSLRLDFDLREGLVFTEDDSAPWEKTFTITADSPWTRYSYLLASGYNYRAYPKLVLDNDPQGAIYFTDIQLEEFRLTDYQYGGMEVSGRFNGGTGKVF